MHRSQKTEVVKALQDTFQNKTLVVVVKHSGMTVAEMTDLRSKLREVSANFRVTKNRLTKIAVREAKVDGIEPLFSGPTAIASSVDPVAAAKVTADFAKSNDKIEILGGVLSGRVLSKDEVNALAKLPSLDELRGTLVGVIQAPATKIARVLSAPATQVARVLHAYSSKS